MKKLLGVLLVFLANSPVRAEESLFFPTPGTKPGQPVKMEFRPAPDVKIIGIKMVFERVILPKKGGEEKAPQKDEKPVAPPLLRKIEHIAFWEQSAWKIGGLEFKVGEPAMKEAFASPPLLAVFSRKF